MNFAAGCTAGLSLCPDFFDNRNGEVPKVHPAFLPSCTEIVGVFASIYHSGYTREEMIENTLAHQYCDVVFSKETEFFSGDEFETSFKMISAVQKKSGISIVTKFSHTKHRGSDSNLIAEGYFGGVLLGATLEGKDTSIGSVPNRPQWNNSEGYEKSTTLVLPSNAAHVWDACIRNTRVPKAKSSDINVHTNLALAEKAGFKSRTFTGLCLLANVMTLLLSISSTSAFSSKFTKLERYGCRFSKPVMAMFDEICLDIQYSLHVHESKLTIFFQVIQETDGAAIKDGYMVLSIPASHL
eukprot:CAMPEP_0184015228 /NCGR_PEP_ID=MMETSP0954-20121128/6174_1 /TAXON_ID=627963 /ORGANISM="Aplanochytrium sp, Strain PBS07" /LENGTH=296 /DNA_ID=CAMNT_0026295949 /DNA_START=41 /DNA_END=928 /DNA_ORIENTATION=-